MRIIPKSLFGRLVLVLLAGLIIAQTISAYFLLHDRGQTLYQAIQESMITRTSAIVRLLDSTPPDKRERFLPLLSSPELAIKLADNPFETTTNDSESKFVSKVVTQRLENNLPSEMKVRVSIDGNVMASRFPQMHRRHMMRNGSGPPWAQQIGPHAMARFVLIQVQLQDSSWVIFERGVPENTFIWPAKILIVLGILLISVIVISLLAVKTITRPLDRLRMAAEGLGKNIQQEPLSESGPTEVKETAIAFNQMQQRLKNYIEDKAEILAAVSHDLKTPLTRLRLRTDLLDDNEVSKKIEKDLDDMEKMVTATLDFMRGSESKEERQPIDLIALLESIQDDFNEAGNRVTFNGHSNAPFQGKPLALKRCIINLVENGIRYGEKVDISLEDNPLDISILICDYGPGIPYELHEKVFAPFYRLENSRAQHTGGTGLGLGIARNVARAHGGELTFSKQDNGHFCVIIKLPR